MSLELKKINFSRSLSNSYSDNGFHRVLILTLSIVDLKTIVRTRCFMANFSLIYMAFSEEKKKKGAWENLHFVGGLWWGVSLNY